MPEKKSWGETVVGWFVEQDESEEPTRDPEEALKAMEEPASNPKQEPKTQPQQPAAASPVELKGDIPAPEPGGGLDFAAVYRAAGIDGDAQDRVEKAVTLLKTLPSDASDDVKRQIVEASLKAFGYPVDQIIEAGAKEIQALQAFIELGQRSTGQLLAESEERIAALNEEIAQLREQTEHKLAAQKRLTEQCNKQKLHVQGVLEFFGQETVASVVNKEAAPPSPDSA